MLVLSIDIGITHLAHCLVSVTDTFQIMDWDVINLTERNKMKCFQCNKNPFY